MQISPYASPWGNQAISPPAMQPMQPLGRQSLQTANAGPSLGSALPSAMPGNDMLENCMNILSQLLMMIVPLMTQLQGGGQNSLTGDQDSLTNGQQSPPSAQGQEPYNPQGYGDSPSDSSSGGENTESPPSDYSPAPTRNTSKPNGQAKSTGQNGGGVPAYGSPNWGAPAQETTGPNGAYQVPGGFEPPKGDEKAIGDPNVDANPGNIQAPTTAPDDSKSHSRVDGNTQKHSIQQIDQMYGASIQKALDKYNAKYGTHCAKQVVEGIIYQETQGDPNTFGKDDSAKSRGLMQVTADNAARNAPGKNQYNPDVSIDTGVEAFTRVLAQQNGNYSRALASYNQGIDTTPQGKAYAQWVQLWASQAP